MEKPPNLPASILFFLILSANAAWGTEAQALPPLQEQRPVAEAIQLLELWIEEQREHQDLPGLSVGVVHGGELIWSRGFGLSDRETKTPATKQTLYRVGSVTKLFTATATMLLRDAGKLDLHDPVAQHLPWFRLGKAFDDHPPITIWHLLTHTSGLPREAAFPYWTTHDFPQRQAVIEALPTQEAIYPPGTKYKYSNLGMALLGEVVAAASGMPYADYVAKMIFLPLGMSASVVTPGKEELSRMATAYMRRLPGGERKIFEYYDTRALTPAANIVSNIEDLARFATLHLNREQEKGGARILVGSTLAEMQRPQWLRESWSGAIGLGFRLSRREGKTLVSHGGWVGGNRTQFLLVPEDGTAVIVIVNADDGSPGFFASRIHATLAPALAKADAKNKAPKATVDRRAWPLYVGTYTDPWDWQYRVMIRGQELVLYEHSYPPGEDPEDSLSLLEPVAEHTFRLSDGELLVFEMGEGDRVQRVRRRYEYLYPVAAP